ncbi:MAG: translation elongation factor Ts [Deltaproteobacteria bacterium]|nr:translation elongation factor Ts [Deltaproteobacteria bacterium]
MSASNGTAISPTMVKELRQKTGAGMMDCKQALQEAGGSMELAIEVLRKKGLKDLSKRAGKVAAEGAIGVYVHPGDQIVSIVELNCETDFVARGDDFKTLARDIAMHVAAMRPKYVSVDDIPANVIDKEKEIVLEQLNEAQKAKADMIIPGKLESFYQDTVLLKQSYVKDDSGKKSVADLVNELSVKVGEKIQVRRFERFEVGEGIEKSKSNLAEEVAATLS